MVVQVLWTSGPTADPWRAHSSRRCCTRCALPPRASATSPSSSSCRTSHLTHTSHETPTIHLLHATCVCAGWCWCWCWCHASLGLGPSHRMLDITLLDQSTLTRVPVPVPVCVCVQPGAWKIFRRKFCRHLLCCRRSCRARSKHVIATCFSDRDRGGGGGDGGSSISPLEISPSSAQTQSTHLLSAADQTYDRDGDDHRFSSEESQRPSGNLRWVHAVSSFVIFACVCVN